MDIVNAEIEAYLGRLDPPSDPILIAMEAMGHAQRFPIVGPLVGRLLHLCARMIGARRVFEMGSGFGYSTYWFAQAVGPGGTVVFTDDDPGQARQAEDFLRRAGLLDRVRIEVGDAVAILDRTPGPFDVVFMDIEKARYPEACARALPKIRPGGLLLADNVLWFGSVLEESTDPAVLGIQAFTRLILTTPGLVSTVIPLRDGVSVSLKQ